MFKNYLKIAVRNLFKNRVFSLINVGGLAVGMACFILLFLFIRHETSFDEYHENANRLYRVVRENAAPTAFRLAPTLNNDFPEVQAVRFRKDRQPALIRVGEESFFENGMFWADAEALEIFSFKMLAGNPKTALTQPFSVVLTKTLAEKYFGQEESVGKQVQLRWGEKYYDLLVTGVLEDVPANSHFTFDLLVSFESTKTAWPEFFLQDWSATFAQTYVLLPENNAPATLEAQFPDFVARHLGEERRENYTDVLARLQPITDIHLSSQLSGEIAPNSDRTYIVLAGVIAFLILVVACINYMNLVTARSLNRAKEIGVRKVSGAGRGQLIKQFLGESLLIAAIATTIALFLVEIFLPIFSRFVQARLTFEYGEDILLLSGIVALTFSVGVLSGGYPAFFLSAFRPAHALKGGSQRTQKSFFRQALVVTQFAVAIVLISGTIVIRNQMQFVQNQRLGFNKEQILVIPQARKIRDNPELLKNEMLKIPGVRQATVSSHVPSNDLSIRVTAKPEGGLLQNDDEPWRVSTVSADPDFMQTFDIQLLQGRTLDKRIATDSTEAYLVNQALVRELGWEAPLGKIMDTEFRTGSPSLPFEQRRGHIVGVVEDFHFESMHRRIEPMIFMIKPYWYFYISLKLRPENFDATLAGLENTWAQFFPDVPFEYFFLDENFDRLYQTERAWGQAIGVFSMLSILIACLGLFGLAAFAAEQRIKEIGVRKVLGATTIKITALLSKDFVRLVVIANLLAWPIAWFAMNNWLENFAYRTDVGWWILALAGGAALLIAVFTVGWQAVRAASVNPVESLKCE